MRVVVVLAQPQLEAGAALVALAVVGRRQARIGDLRSGSPRCRARPPRRPRRRARRRPPGAGSRARRRALVAEPGATPCGRARSGSQSGSPHAWPRWPRQRDLRARPPARTVPRTRHELLVALHPAGSATGRAGELGRRRERLEARGRSRASSPSQRDRPALERRVDRHAQAAERRRLPARVGRRAPPPRERRDRLAPREQDRQRAAAAARRRGRAARARTSRAAGSANENVTASVKRRAARRARGASCCVDHGCTGAGGPAVGLDVDRRALDVVAAAPRRPRRRGARRAATGAAATACGAAAAHEQPRGSARASAAAAAARRGCR